VFVADDGFRIFLVDSRRETIGSPSQAGQQDRSAPKPEVPGAKSDPLTRAPHSVQ